MVDDLGVAAAGVTGFDERIQVIYQNTQPRRVRGFSYPKLLTGMAACWPKAVMPNRRKRFLNHVCLRP